MDTARATADAPPARTSPLTLPVVLVGVVLVAMSISGTAVALPSIGEELGAAGSPLNWIVAGYNLAFAAMTLVAGAAADRLGRRRVFTLAALVFAGGFAATAASTSIVVADIARVVSGAGGAGIMAAGGALLASAYDGAARRRAFALMGTMAGVGIAIGPTLSGLLVSATGWRGGFIAFTAVALLVALGATRTRESRAEGGGTDPVGSALFVASLALLMFALLEGSTLGWTDPVVLATAVGGVLAMVAFGLVQKRAAAPVLTPALVANRPFLGWSTATLTTSIGFLGALVFLPTYLQAAAGLSPAEAGTAMLLLTAPVLVAPMAAAGLVDRGVSARLVIMASLVLVVAGNLWLTALDADNAVAVAAVPLLLIGVGMGASFGITDGQAMSLVPADTVGVAAGFLNTLRGAAEALVIAAFSASLGGLLTARLGDAERAASVSSGHLSPAGAATELDAFTWSWRTTQFGVAGLCLLLSVVVAILIYGRGEPSTRTT
ncbi:MFS transporter [Phytomonospora endophytica]|uniref:MFS family permease n=1 Tax=Phytomonospora endophytica TaxID=714109 RepID=A0A841FRQ5_9ACTN|nr:MFS transporter [Phytomonospora endophytica]MBB6038736.1 MFS family permease [Phytomonospora endophytica]GIG68468.1 MFS transporter [Phytomonospora endophytica]